MKGQLILEDGKIFTGDIFAAEDEISGEIVVNPSMTGYQEILTDPAYYGKIVLLTYPLIGNYGINRDDFEGVLPQVKAVILANFSKKPSNFRAEESLESYLKSHQITGLAKIDTRKLMRHIQKHGNMKGTITNIDASPTEVIKKLKNIKTEKKPVKQVASQKPYVIPGRGKRVVVVDLGLKHGILRALTNRSCHITVVPYNYTAEAILRLKPEGILLTSGPGNPKLLPETIEMTKKVLGKVPLLGIGMGQQIFALASGASLEKMSVSHTGPFPVKDLLLEKTYMTTQNHEYTIVQESLRSTNLQVTHINLQDRTIEGVRHKNFPAFGVEFYPESTPGPEDAEYIFDQFMKEMIRKEKVND